MSKQSTSVKQSPPRKSGIFSSGRAPHSHSNAHSVRRSWPYTRAAIYWIATNIAMFVAIGAIVYGVKMENKDFVLYGIISVALFLFFKLCFILASKTTPCPLCRANHLARTRSNKHKDAYKLFFFSYSSTAVLTAFFKGSVRCMHCGVTFALYRRRK